jgi:uncharacterized protein
VRPALGLLLTAVHSLQRSSERVRTLVFTNRLVDVTRTFKSQPFERALAALTSGMTVPLNANSNYGAVFEQLEVMARSRLRHDVVVILGDARSNYLPPAADRLGRVRRLVRKVVWLVPEAPSSWGRADSALAEYREHTSTLMPCYDLASLRQAVDHLARDLR